MRPINRSLLLGVFAASALTVSLTNLRAQSDDFAQHLGPVGPHEPILTTFGNKRVIAFYEADEGRCVVNAVVWEKTDAQTGMTTAARVRISLNPRQVVHIDSTDNQTINLECGDHAERLALIDSSNLIAASASE
jgi:hypothetical protein